MANPDEEDANDQLDEAQADLANTPHRSLADLANSGYIFSLEELVRQNYGTCPDC